MNIYIYHLVLLYSLHVANPSETPTELRRTRSGNIQCTPLSSVYDRNAICKSLDFIFQQSEGSLSSQLEVATVRVSVLK